MNQQAPFPADAGKWSADHAAYLAHMNMLQGIVNRLATSSASCKTWCVGMVTALLAAAGSTRAPALLQLALVPVLVFAFMDIHYLSQESWFRAQFNAYAAKGQQNTYVQGDVFAVGRRTGSEAFSGFVGAMTSWSVWPVYGGIIAAYFWALCAGWLELLATAPAKG
jgi:hypothetical protein